MDWENKGIALVKSLGRISFHHYFADYGTALKSLSIDFKPNTYFLVMFIITPLSQGSYLLEYEL